LFGLCQPGVLPRLLLRLTTAHPSTRWPLRRDIGNRRYRRRPIVRGLDRIGDATKCFRPCDFADQRWGADTHLALVSQSINRSGLQLPTAVEHPVSEYWQLAWRFRVLSARPVGRLIEAGAIDRDSAAILPESFRRYTTPHTMSLTAWLPRQVYGEDTPYALRRYR